MVTKEAAILGTLPVFFFLSIKYVLFISPHCKTQNRSLCCMKDKSHKICENEVNDENSFLKSRH